MFTDKIISSPSLKSEGLFYFEVMKRHLFVSFLVLMTNGIGSQGYYTFDSALEGVYADIVDLKLNSAKKDLKSYSSESEGNLMVPFLDAYIDFFQVFISERKVSYEAFLSNQKERIVRLKQGEETSPYYRYCLAETHLKTALIRLKFEDYLLAFRDVSKAFHLLKENREVFPEFGLSLKSLGMLHAMVGTVPEQYQWGVSLMGLDGSILEGCREVEELIESGEGQQFRQEILVTYAYMLMFLAKEQDKAWQVLQDPSLDHTQSPLLTFVKASFLARQGESAGAKVILDSCPRGDAYTSFPHIDYLSGLMALYNLEEGSDDQLKSFIDSFEGRHYIKDACYKLAWHDLIFNGGESYEYWLKECISKGVAVVDADKAALQAATAGTAPQLDLLKARLLFDGGYYQRALNILAVTRYDDDSFNELERKYRSARCLEGLGKTEDAKVFYIEALSYGNMSNSYMVANAALRLGLMFEEEGELALARFYYERCLSMDADSYQSSINQKARAGLERVGTK